MKFLRDRIKSGHDRELVQSYPYRSACPSAVWAELIDSAGDELFFAGYTNYSSGRRSRPSRTAPRSCGAPSDLLPTR